MDLKSIILATGPQSNMKSNKATVLHCILGKPLISYSLKAVKGLGITQIGLIADQQGQDIEQALGHEVIGLIHTPTAISSFVGDKGDILILNGDAPLITKTSLKELLEIHEKANNEATHLWGTYVIKAGLLKATLLKAKDDTDQDWNFAQVLEILAEQGFIVDPPLKPDTSEMLRVNSRSDLAQCTRIMKERINQQHMDNGVTLEDPQNTYIEADVSIGYDTIIEPNCMLKGKTTIGNDCFIGCNSNIKDTRIGNGVHIESSQVQQSSIDDHAHIGPFAYIRPNSKIGKHVKIGDFVEIKNSNIGDHTKISHLTYVGDADVGQYVNFGCGSVLVNYDGVNKHRSKIEDYAFIGCNTNLVSPVKIGERAYTAAGSTITADVPAESLGISRVKQVNKEGWVAYKYPKTK